MRHCPPTLLASAAALTLAGANASAQCIPYQGLDLPALTLESGRRLGTSVAVSGSNAVLGSVNGVHLVTRNPDGSLMVSPSLAPGGSGPGDLFGVAVAISSDTLVVGASLEDTYASDAGAVYVMDISGDAPLQFQPLAPITPGAGDWFGRSVAIGGDQIAVGSPANDTGGASAGAVTIAQRVGLTWGATHTLASPDPDDFDLFGQSVAMDSGWLVVGCPGDDDAAVNAGAIYVYRLEADRWVFSERIVASDASVFDSFGQSVDIKGDRLVVGAWGDDDAAPNAGAVYVFRLLGDVWLEEQKLTAAGAEASDMLGASVAIDGDTIVSGAVMGDGNAPDSGVTAVFQYSGEGWFQIATIPGQAPGAYTGGSVALCDDLLLVGAPFDDAGGQDAGRVLAFDLGAPACPGDIDLDCLVGVSDAVEFLALFESMHPSADRALPEGRYDFSDVVAFIADFQMGCP